MGQQQKSQAAQEQASGSSGVDTGLEASKATPQGGEGLDQGALLEMQGGAGNQAALDAMRSAQGGESGSKGESSASTEEEAALAHAATAKFDAFNAQEHLVENYAFLGWGNFDLHYTPSANKVNVEIRLGFNFIDSPVPTGGVAGDYTWSDESKLEWKTDFVSSVEETWSDQHTLQCDYSDPNHKSKPTWSDLTPSVTIDIVEDSGDPHFDVNVKKIPEGEFERSSISRPPRDASGEPTSAGLATLDSEDMQAVTKRTSPSGTTQRGAVHEFGHMIGLQDEYTGSASNVGKPTRQGTTKGMADNASIMSGGEVVEEAHYASVVAALNTAVLPHNVTFSIK